MKKFENPFLEIEKLEIMDVITTSNGAECTMDCPLDGMVCEIHI